MRIEKSAKVIIEKTVLEFQNLKTKIQPKMYSVSRRYTNSKFS